jgi:UDP-GlcNAc:undecaprenyl-phosphate GlcNAc-1-phosphate transferase
MIGLSSNSPVLWILPLLIAGIGSAGAGPAVIRLARRTDIIDHPIAGKIHTVATPLLGGIALYVGCVVAIVVFLPLSGVMRAIICGGGVALVVGIMDDRLKLSPLVHLGGQLLVAGVTIVTGLGLVTSISNPFASLPMTDQGHGNWILPSAVGLIFTVFWLVGMMNTVNFLDGLDGLSIGVCAIAATGLAVWAGEHSSPAFHHADLVLPVIVVGSLLGLLPFNWNPAHLFIGDSGVLFLGVALGAISLSAPAKIGTALLLLIIPVLDVAWAIVRRIVNRRSFLSGDKQHVYHRMVEIGLSRRATVLIMYLLCGAMAATDLCVEGRVYKVVAFAVVAVLTGAGFVRLELAGRRITHVAGPQPTKQPAGTGD